MTTRLQLGNIAVDVLLKDIKNVHLSVHPPTGRVAGRPLGRPGPGLGRGVDAPLPPPPRPGTAKSCIAQCRPVPACAGLHVAGRSPACPAAFSRIVSRLMRDGAEIRTRPVGGWTLR